MANTSLHRQTRPRCYLSQLSALLYVPTYTLSALYCAGDGLTTHCLQVGFKLSISRLRVLFGEVNVTKNERVDDSLYARLMIECLQQNRSRLKAYVFWFNRED
ncbi:hypothetical protein M9H77_27451 [Catharanthus roseus]|uniref:Uncharacterized protein n=1 Tax=Catharanthus roseus TaxID=4058 RepID=A0ACC0AGT9_CATRO|nr:hypothetical protein M9H77_27451 [Catharanthus roseus]